MSGQTCGGPLPGEPLPAPHRCRARGLGAVVSSAAWMPPPHDVWIALAGVELRGSGRALPPSPGRRWHWVSLCGAALADWRYLSFLARVRWLARSACPGRLVRDPAPFGALGLPMLVPGESQLLSRPIRSFGLLA